MIHYNFPRIETIDDVLPHLENRSEFNVTQRPDYTVISYSVQTPETFKWDPDDPVGSAMRRECRGLIFESDGMNRIIRRPFHKFKNVNEDEQYQIQNIDLNRAHWIREKMDGSMIAPFFIPGSDRVVYGTKRGLTDIGNDAARFVVNSWSPECRNWVNQFLKDGYTPIFEWCGPNNRIVVDYESTQLTLIGVRNRITGEYLVDLHSLGFPGSVVNEPEIINGDYSVSDIVNKCQTLENEEGYVLTFNDGHMVKFKGDWYLQIHKNKEMVNSLRLIINLVYNNRLDDAISVLPATDQNYVNDQVGDFMSWYHHACVVLEHHLDRIRENYGDDRKRIAQEYMVHLDKTMTSLLFESIGSGRSVADCFWNRVGQVSERSNKRFDEFVNWIKSV